MPRYYNTALPPLEIGSLEITDMYHISGCIVPHAVIKDIVSPDSTGRDYMVVGAEHDDSTSLGVTFSEQGDRQNKIYEETMEDLFNRMIEISNYVKRHPVSPVSCYMFANMAGRIELNFLDAPHVFAMGGRQLCGWRFELKVSRYSDGS